ncbi:MAG: AAA family ATPase [Candidatus Goldbacteria bacterium]|nr:AAA family ATPase [Candidatus Goldiibacteriota bacterium]
MFLGFTGPNASGKGEAIKYLVEKHKFVSYSLSDILRSELKSRGVEINRDNLISVGNELREKHGPGVLAKLAVEKIKNMPQAIVDSIRNPSEIEELRKNLKDFKLIGINADTKVRYERAGKRGRENENRMSYEEFIANEQKENSKAQTGQQLLKCFEMADVKIDNSGTVEELHKKLEDVLKNFGYKPYKRPAWDEYFMKMAYLVAERSTCIRHHIGAVIVKDNYVISTGYNGAASGVTDCLELGCLRDQMGITSGTRHEVCRAIHAEQNAIIQAALHGATTEKAALYCTHSPCILCAKMIVNAKIKKVIVSKYYPDKSYEDLFKEANVEFRIIETPDLTINTLD